MIEVSHVTKDYGVRRAVDDLSFTLEKGRVYGFLGPNGAGKSTTMNIMTGYIAASGGTVRINGHDILRDAEKAKKDVGYLPEIVPVYDDMTVSEYLAFVSALKKVPKKDRRDQNARIMKMTMLGGYGSRMIRNLSKGYRQRVGLAQALVGFPEVIILDEPTVGLDPQQIIEIRQLIHSLRPEHTVVLSSHILSEVNAVCDEVMIISRGKLVAQGTPEELEARYGGEDTLSLRLMAGEDRVREALLPLAGETLALEPGEEATEAVLSLRGGEDGLKELAKALLAAQIPVLSMVRKSRSLEEVFLSVTQATPGEALREDRKTEDAAAETKKDAEAAEVSDAEREDAPGEDGDISSGKEEEA